MDRIEKLKQFLKDSPEDAFLQHALALEYVKTGNDAAAIALFKEILERDPAYVGSYYHLGKALERMNLPQEAMGIYEKGMQQSREAGNNHAFNELQAAWEDADDL